LASPHRILSGRTRFRTGGPLCGRYRPAADLVRQRHDLGRAARQTKFLIEALSRRANAQRCGDQVGARRTGDIDLKIDADTKLAKEFSRLTPRCKPHRFRLRRHKALLCGRDECCRLFDRRETSYVFAVPLRRSPWREHPNIGRIGCSPRHHAILSTRSIASIQQRKHSGFKVGALRALLPDHPLQWNEFISGRAHSSSWPEGPNPACPFQSS